MQRPSWAPDEVDLERPSAARVYDYYLGGLHNFAADREMAARAVADWPELPRIMQANRAFLRRAVRYLAAQGIDQFLDIGSGIPTAGNVHEVAQAAPATRAWSTSTTTRSPSPTPARCSPTTPPPASSRPTSST